MSGEIPAPIKPPTARPLAGRPRPGQVTRIDRLTRESERERERETPLLNCDSTWEPGEVDGERERLRWVSRKIKPLLEEHTETNGNRAA